MIWFLHYSDHFQQSLLICSKERWFSVAKLFFSSNKKLWKCTKVQWSVYLSYQLQHHLAIKQHSILQIGSKIFSVVIWHQISYEWVSKFIFLRIKKTRKKRTTIGGDNVFQQVYFFYPITVQKKRKISFLSHIIFQLIFMHISNQ